MNAMLQQFNLPNFIDGLSFADASKKIQSRFKERTDPESIATEKDMLDRLKQMQEHVKAQQEAQQEAQSPPQEGEMRVNGSNEEIDQPTEEFSQEEDLMNQIQNSQKGNQYAWGGDYDEEEYDMHAMPETAEQRFATTISANNASITESITSLAKTGEKVANPEESKESEDSEQGEKEGPGVADYVKAGVTAVDLGKEAFGPTGVDTSGRVRVEKEQAGNSALSGAAKGASAGMAFGPWGAAAGAVIGGAAGFFGSKRQQKDADKANLNATYADAAVNDSQFALGGEEDDRVKISDNRKIRATTRQRMDPNVDLVSGNYSSKTITDIVNASLKNGVDPDTAIALAMQESKIGNTDENLGHIVGGSYRGQEANDMTKLLSEKMHAGRKLGRKTDEELLQMYNGTGKIFPSTEQEDHGFKMKKAYGVPVGEKGIDMGKTNLYGIQVKDIRDNVIKKDKKIASMVKDLRGNFNHFEGRQYSKVDPRTYDDPLGIAPGARDNLNPKMFALGGNEINQFKKGGYDSNGKFIKPSVSKEMDADLMGLIRKDSKNSEDVTGVLAGFEKVYKEKLNKEKAEKPKSEDGITGNLDKLRYAPALGNALQLSQLKQPEQETTPELNTRYKKNLVDEKGLINLVQEETSANREAILGSSEGSGNAARANLLATQLNSTKALSDAFMKSQEANARESAQEQSFNLGIDTTNLQQKTLAQDIRARNKGAYDTEKSRLKTAIATDIGSIGQEELYKKFPELMGMDYGAFGEYLKLKEKEKVKKAKEKSS